MGLKPRFLRLLDEDRASRRTMSDAIELLYQRACFQNSDRAEIHIGLLALPSSKIVGLIDVQFEDFRGEMVHCVSLPTSGQFRAVRHHSKRGEIFDIAELIGATVNGAGQVTLADGTLVHALEVLPAQLQYEPSELDWRIVHHVVAIADAQEHCYRRWPDGLEFTGAKSDSDRRRLRLDCSTLRNLGLPPLKVLHHAITEFDPELKFSKQKLADVLAMFGIREVAARPRLT